MTIFLTDAASVPCSGLWEIREFPLAVAQNYAFRDQLVNYIEDSAAAATASILLGRTYDSSADRPPLPVEVGDWLVIAPTADGAAVVDPLTYMVRFAKCVHSGTYVHAMREAVARNKERELWAQRTAAATTLETRDFMGGHRD